MRMLAEGAGPVITAKDSVQLHYLGVRWSDGQTFDGNFDSAPADFPLGNVIVGFRLGLVGQHVGSTLLVSIPAQFAYGESTESATNPLTGQDLLFLINVLGATQPTQ
ncbi:MAG: hypothetical protein F2808_01100 [Actinobacteria bacterium]|uniref:peptidylprolyl isomerase n=1 Tax=freshwater metagenome TaxID=449393 RepID=A0A6J7F396_9ZZZZ|nr:hypothetical protein [Actinomycetota bacterium]